MLETVQGMNIRGFPIPQSRAAVLFTDSMLIPDIKLVDVAAPSPVFLR
jgi:hypothetical protein